MPDIGWPEILIIAIVILVLFGSRKLPDAARSLGRSMRIFRTEIKGMHDDDDQPTAPSAAQPTTSQSLPQSLPAGTTPATPVEQTQPAPAVGDNADGR
jgi:sec-independent protein translocase protein TatA